MGRFKSTEKMEGYKTMTTTKEIKREGFTDAQIKEAIGNTPIGLPYVQADIQKLRWAASRYLEAQKPAQANEIPADAFTKPGAVVRVDVDTTAELVRQLAKAREVLAWYADESHWQFTHVPQSNIVWNDRGQRAQDFLGVGE
jgi:hypothetical protein